MIFVLTVTVWAMLENLVYFWKSGDMTLVTMSLVILILTAWLLTGGISTLARKKGFTASMPGATRD
jgi:uncharacterized membrane protein YdbT with pleckstrin-like domain